MKESKEMRARLVRQGWLEPVSTEKKQGKEASAPLHDDQDEGEWQPDAPFDDEELVGEAVELARVFMIPQGMAQMKIPPSVPLFCVCGVFVKAAEMQRRAVCGECALKMAPYRLGPCQVQGRRCQHVRM
jgi:hypothetical protein